MSDVMGEDSKAYEPRKLQNRDAVEAIGASVMLYGIKKMATRLRKSESHLYGELNPGGDQRHAKLSFDDAIEILRLTKDPTGFQLALEDVGWHVVPADAVPDKATVAEESTDDVVELGNFTRVVNDPEATIKQVRKASMVLRQEIRQTEALKVKKIKDAKRKL